jgi:uncharacterized protein with NAD-binding domain and iron-sulfur cluster
MRGEGEVKVAVVGGGISGLTTALRLAERGYKVTVYEDKPFLGGNLASHDHNDDGVYHDVYPHMFSNFYVNFWNLVEKDLGLRRDKSESSDFAVRNSVKVIRLNRKDYMEMKDAGSLEGLRTNLFCGVAPPLDMYLWAYSMLDMLAHSFDPDTQLSSYSISGFVQSRRYATEQVVALHDFVVLVIWSVHADETSASSYRNFLHHTFGNLSPLVWLLKGSLQQKIIHPLEHKLERLGCEIRKNTRVMSVKVDGASVSEIKVESTSFDAHKHEVIQQRRKDDHPNLKDEHAFDYVVLAVPPSALCALIQSSSVELGHRIVDRLPQLAEVRRLDSEPIAVLDLYFKRKLQGIPAENIFMIDSGCELTCIDLSQLWDTPEMKNVTAVTLAISDYWALPSDRAEENKHAIVRMFHRYVPQFNPGTHWGDENSDIDWARSHYTANKADTLFVNQVGSEAWRPEPHYPAVSNLFFAGDLCRNHIDMATVEAAVTSGLNAAAAIHVEEPLGKPIEIAHLDTYPQSAILAMKLLMAPSAYAAKCWLTVADAATRAASGKMSEDWSTDLGELVGLPYAYAADCLKTAGALWGNVWLGGWRRRG